MAGLRSAESCLTGSRPCRDLRSQPQGRANRMRKLVGSLGLVGSLDGLRAGHDRGQ